jgi:hypothetical protein
MTMVARVTAARVRLQIDVRFGDAVTPPPVRMDLPVLLDFPMPRLLVYSRETVVAEKLDALVQFGTASSRMKDFYDLFVLARGFDFDGALLVRAIRATFERRKTPLPGELPTGLTNEFVTDPAKAGYRAGSRGRPNGPGLLRVRHPGLDHVGVRAVLARERDERRLGRVRLAVAPAQRREILFAPALAGVVVSAVGMPGYWTGRK